LEEFQSDLRAEVVQPLKDGSYDIGPALVYIRSLGRNETTMSMRNLSRKAAWLTAMVGFLRPSDMARIDLGQSVFLEPAPAIRLAMMVAPKEQRRGGQRYVKSITLDKHDDPAICPVRALRAYYDRLGRPTTRHPHPIDPRISVTPLFRRITGKSDAPILATTISNNVREVMRHVRREPASLPVPKARALGATIAALAGTPIDDIVARGSWSSKEMFYHFYRISSSTMTNFSAITL
ncbi:hypothetical protein BC940DRAFT_223660, partial [Gongronella butleri]